MQRNECRTLCFSFSYRVNSKLFSEFMKYDVWKKYNLKTANEKKKIKKLYDQGKKLFYSVYLILRTLKLLRFFFSKKINFSIIFKNIF